MTTRRMLASDLRAVRDLRSGGETASREIGGHGVEADRPGAGSQPLAWNNSTTIVQIIRDRLVEHAGNVNTGPQPALGPAPRLEPRPPNLGVGLWR